MDNDDKPVGKILSRREALGLLGASGLALLIGCRPTGNSAEAPTTAATSAPTDMPAPPTVAEPTLASATEAAAASTELAETPVCVVRPELTEGPYYVDVDMLREDVREDRAGTPLALTFNVLQISDDGCMPMEGALVEIWHCDADGVYSGVNAASGQTWLRGAQPTDANGVARFTTIYPGWYPGRCVHIHFKIRPTETREFTSQLFFPDAATTEIHTRDPYAAKGQPDRLNSSDSIFQPELLLDPTLDGDGVAATFPIGIDLST